MSLWLQAKTSWFSLRRVLSAWRTIGLVRVPILVVRSGLELLRIITSHNRQFDCVEGVYLCPLEPNKRGDGRDQSFLVNLYLLERRVAEDVSRASVVN